MNFHIYDNFLKKIKRLKKRFSHVEKAVEVLEQVLTVAPLHTKSKPISDLGKTVTLPVLKISMACKNVEGKRFRVVYAYDKDNNTIIFLDVYFKGDQENHDKKVILAYFKDRE